MDGEMSSYILFLLQDEPNPILSYHFSSSCLLAPAAAKTPLSNRLLLFSQKKKNHLLLFFPQTTKLGRHGFFAARPSPLSVHAKKPIYHRIQNEQT